MSEIPSNVPKQLDPIEVLQVPETGEGIQVEQDGSGLGQRQSKRDERERVIGNIRLLPNNMEVCPD